MNTSRAVDCTNSDLSKRARSASTVMQLAPFHQPHVSQMPDSWLYQSLSVSRAVSAREMAVWADAVAPKREMREIGRCGLMVMVLGAEL